MWPPSRWAASLDSVFDDALSKGYAQKPEPILRRLPSACGDILGLAPRK